MSKPCQYGAVVSLPCGRPSVTKRQRPAGGETWDLCKQHAAFLDRLRANIEANADLLERLGDQ